MKAKIALMSIVLMLSISFIGCGSSIEPVVDPSKEQSSINSELTFGDTFVCGDFEITLGTEVKWDTVDKEWSEEHGMTVFGFPVTLKNVDTESHGFYSTDYRAYKPDGTQIKDQTNTSFDDSVDLMGKIQPDAQNTGFIYVAYYGDGDYSIEFGYMNDKVKAKLPITK